MREIRIDDTLTGALRTLEPRDPGRVGIYACGPTVYSPIHVGNARPYVVFSMLKRFLEHEGYATTLVINVTDVNDKIYAAAAAAGVPSDELVREMTERYVEDTDRLGLGRPDREPKASETIGPIVALIESLIERGHAYASGGDVYFRVRSFPGYGKLSNRPLAEMQQGEDEADVALKEEPHDFALWKAHKPGEDTAWDTPWGRGRPGWHIECSAMAEELLGLDFEIHGGGSDLVFPHHENEIAQTEAARGAPLARVWMHNGIVRLSDEKMSKSVGNIRVLGEALDRFGRDALVNYLASGHYRRPLAFSEELLDEAARSVDRVRELCRRLDPSAPAPEALDPYAERFFAALADDFNTPAARAELFDWVGAANRRLDAGERVGVGALAAMLTCLGIDNLLPGAGAARDAGEVLPDARVRELLAEREAARAAGDFATADSRRDEIAALGWEVRDTPSGPELVARR
ncbi:MAG TPA: cysteine--tRNA ligase [Thermoleophilaceae bacterium]|nr:cysteine--tRNA ligase [Thermoleophilaceae bacterium]